MASAAAKRNRDQHNNNYDRKVKESKLEAGAYNTIFPPLSNKEK